MRRTFAALVLCVPLVAVPALFGQEAAVTTSPVSIVPHLIKYSGTLPDAPASASVVDVTFALYENQTGGDPLWTEKQTVALDPTSKYTVLLGSATQEGLPHDIFASGQARWIGVTLAGQAESPRTILVATPYSLKASDAETVGGHPASDFALVKKDANGKPDTLTSITTITGTNGVLVGGVENSSGTGPTVALTLDPTYLATLGNTYYAQLGAANTFKGNQTIQGNLSVSGTGVVTNLIGINGVEVTNSGNVYTAQISPTTAAAFGNGLWAQIAAANTFTAAQTFSVPATFASSQTFPGTASLTSANTFSGTQTITSNGTATASNGQNSFELQLSASAYNSSTSAAGPINFFLKSEPTGNNTASPAGTLNFLYGTGSGASETGLKIANTGIVTFASGQTFPGTGTGDGTLTGITTSSPLSGSGTSGSVALSLNTSALETTLDGIYPQLSAANTFAGANTFSEPITFAASQTFPGTALLSGGNTFSGTQVLTSGGTATAGGGHDSYSLQLTASSYDSATAAAVPVNFVWKAEHLGNNTASPSGTINLLYGTGTGVSETGLNISSAGVINFASGQTFPGTGTGDGTITGITTTSPLSGSGTSGSVALSLNTSSLETTLNGVYPQLGAANTFTSAQTITGGNGTSEFTVTDNGSGNGITATAAGSSSIGVNATGGSYGVQGTSTNGTGVNGTGGSYGVQGTSTNGTGVSGSGATGVSGSSTTSQGVYGTTSATGGPAGVYGNSSATTIGSDNFPGIGMSGNASGPSSYGVYGSSTDAAGYGIYGNGNTGVYGQSGTGSGVSGYTTASGGSGVFGKTGSAAGYGTYGGNTDAVGVGDGVHGYVASPYAYGVHAIGVNASAEGSAIGGYGAAIWADTNQGSSLGSFGAVLATADGNYAGAFINDSNVEPTLGLQNDGDAGTGMHVPVLTASGRDGACGMNGSGDVACSGRLKTVVPVAGSEQKVEVYSVQSSENWFEDFGSAKLENGRVTVAIDPQFANIVNTGVQYHVFLTPSGDCKGLYVASRSALGFEVRELGNGGSAVEFDYRIVAKRTGHESERLADATEEMHGLTKLRDDLAARRAKPHPAAKPAMAEQKDLPVLPMGPPPAPQQQPTRMPGSGQGKPAAEGHEVAEVAPHQP